MSTKAAKTRPPKAPAEQSVGQQASRRVAATFPDNRPAAAVQRQQQTSIDSSARQQFTARQKIIAQSPRQQAAQLRALALPANTTGLPDALKAGVEQLSGHSLADVRVHYNSAKPAQLQAHAYAQGTDIHLAPGQEQHLPHEAWHVVQQKQGRVQPTQQLKGIGINNNAGLEQEADVMGTKALQLKRESPSVRAAARPTAQVTQSKAIGHANGCGCAGCCPASSSAAKAPTPVLAAPAHFAPVLQGKWKCEVCGATGDGKANKKKCKECGKTKQTEVKEGREKFGTWFDGLPNERRQELLREHGSHEEEGGVVTKKQQGGGAKGNQHSDGVARAKEQIKEKYERGEYD